MEYIAHGLDRMFSFRNDHCGVYYSKGVWPTLKLNLEYPTLLLSRAKFAKAPDNPASLNETPFADRLHFYRNW